MGLNHPRDIKAWTAWQGKQGPIRRVRSFFASAQDNPPLYMTVRGDNPQILIALESTTPSSIGANLSMLAHMEDCSVAILSPMPLNDVLGGALSTQVLRNGPLVLPEELSGVRVILASGHYMSAGDLAYRWSKQLGIQVTVVQHGLMTPFAPPLPPDSLLLAFSAEDAEFWRSGRADIETDVVGSQLFWNAARRPRLSETVGEEPLFLGQLHGAEIPRIDLARTTQVFCLKNNALYRPHPAETDKLSLFQHEYWRRKGINMDKSRQDLSQISSPVVSIFSTGVLEAAAQGLPSWVTFEGNPPPWLQEFWQRYNMSPWGSEPTAAPVTPQIEPSVAIANHVKNKVGTGL